MNTSQLKKWMLLSFMVSGLMSCTQKEVTLGSLDVIPIPSEVVKLDDGSSFVIDGATKICYPEGNEKMKRNAEFLASYIKKIAATEVKLSTKEGDNAIVLSLDNTLTEEEGYELNVSEERISLKGKTEAGVFYGHLQRINRLHPCRFISRIAPRNHTYHRRHRNCDKHYIRLHNKALTDRKTYDKRHRTACRNAYDTADNTYHRAFG